MTTKMAAVNKYTFHVLQDRKFCCLEDKDSQEYLLKWSMVQNLNVQAFGFDEKFRTYTKNDFVLNFFQDPEVLSSLKVHSDAPLSVPASRVEVEFVPATITSMDFLSRIYKKVVYEDGDIVKCYDDFVGDILIPNELRKMLLVEDSNYYHLYNSNDRQEFLFRLFMHFCVGGTICQYEDKIGPYLDMTKRFYKDIVSVRKDPEAKDIRVTSVVLKVQCYNEENKYYPSNKEHIQNFCYLIIDPIKQHINVLSHVWN